MRIKALLSPSLLPVLLQALFAVTIILVWVSSSVWGQTAPNFGEEIKVAEIKGEGEFLLGDGDNLKLSALLIPGKADCARLKVICPLVEQIEDYLTRSLLGKVGYIDRDTATRDRYNRLLAQVRDDKGIWLQEAFLRRGFARVKTSNAEQGTLNTLLEFETTAREQGKGLWALRAFGLLSPDMLKGKMDRFQIIEGKILKTAKVRNTIYLNFGENWRDDFTIKLAPDMRKAFPGKGKDLLDLMGKQVRVRGWLFWENGPMIALYNPGQLEIIAEQ